jgi:hypothetical protein
MPYALPQGAVMAQPDGTVAPNGAVQQGSESLPAPTK